MKPKVLPPLVSGPTPFDGWDIRTLIDGKAQQRRDHPFLIWEPFEGCGRTWTYGEFALALRRFAAGLQQRGVAPGERVLVHLDNCPESLIAWLGCAYAGAVAVTTNARSSLAELTYYAAHSGAVGAITQPRFAALVAAAAPQLAWICVTETDNGALATAPPLHEPFAAIDADPALLAERPADPLAPFAIQYTSGTTSRPKAVRWSHANALWGARGSAMHQGLSQDDVHLVHLPLFHANAQVYSVGAVLWAGASAVILPRFSASRFWEVSQRRACTWTSMVPFCIRALESLPVPEHHTYRVWGNTSRMTAVEERFGVTTLGWWGMTETLTQGIVGVPGLPTAPGAIGRPTPLTEILVLDSAMRPVAPGETGDLYVRGRRGLSLFLDYADDPEATAASFTADGLFITGDRIRIGEDGSLFFADRSKDMLKVGGENVAASEIEQAIMAVPGVAEVAVVGCSHPMLDEVPVAFVIPRGDVPDLAARIAEACAAQLAAFKCPREVRLVDSLPRSTIEKIAKAELRAQLAAEAAV